MNYTDLGLSQTLVDALKAEQITKPMPIQEKAIPVLLEGKNAYVSAETGTGKTLAFLLPAFEKIDQSINNTQVIVLAPTHELASQIHQQALRLGQHYETPIKSLLLIGGTSTGRQVEKLKKKPQIVVGSVGRMLELVRMKKLKIATVKVLVVDEADRMLSGKSLEEFEELFGRMRSEPQLVFASATEHRESSYQAQELAGELEFLSAAVNQVNPNIEHAYFVGEERSKADQLRRLIRAIEPERAIVFVHKNKDAELVKAKMEYYNIPVADIHGSHGKEERKKAMADIRSGKVSVLIASDIAARGLDIKGVTHIFNYDIPSDSKDYLHRAGRTGRAGAEGFAVSLMTPKEVRLVSRFEKELGIEMIEAMMYEGEIFAADELEEEGAE